MSRMATCPECGRPVTIGDGLADSTEVRCSLCEDELTSSKAADLATAPTPEDDAPEDSAPEDSAPEDDTLEDSTPEGEAPPEVTPVASDGEEAESQPKESEEPDHPADETSGSVEEPGDSAAEEALVRARCPCCSAEFGLDEVLLATTGEPLGHEAVAAITAEGQVKDLSDFAGTATREGAPRIDIDLGNPAGPVVSDGAFDFVAEGDGNADAALASAAAFGRRRPQEKSMMRELIGIVLGGVTGLAIAYYGLNFFGGPRFDFLEIYLPGIEHTSPHRPSWLPGATATDADLGEGELAD